MKAFPLSKLVFVVSLLALPRLLSGAYSWQEEPARVTSQGDIEWSPKPFQFKAGPSVKYIDYEGGNDNNAGTRSAPWKHHPWDSKAEGVAAQCKGVHTYVFKKGVIYRGKLMARESGLPGDPIRLTVDPKWGTGDACLFGSRRISGGWARCTKAEAPDIREPDKVWFIKLGTDITPRGLWVVQGATTTPIPLARDPNWKISNPSDPQSEWHEWEDYDKEKKQAKDSQHLTSDDPKFYEGGHIWTETYIPPHGNMDGICNSPIKEFNVVDHQISAPLLQKGHRYFIENVRALLDSPGEFFYSEKPVLSEGMDHLGARVSGKEEPLNGTLYVRLPEDRNPNSAAIEVSDLIWPIEIRDQNHIEISGLWFSFDSIRNQWGTSWPSHLYDPCFIRVFGSCQGISISNCKFLHVTAALRLFPRPSRETMETYSRDLSNPGQVDVMDDVSFCDNDVAHSERSAVVIRPGGSWHTKRLAADDPVSEVRKVSIMRNRFIHVASRRGTETHGAIPVIDASSVQLLEVAGNIIRQCWGSGIFVTGGKSGGVLHEVPLSRTLIHHNKVTLAMLGCNDYGGIAPWQGGHHYVYSNISGDIIGYKNNRFRLAKNEEQALKDVWLTQANSYYPDGSYKVYVFNNIAWGTDSTFSNKYRNRSAFMSVLGFMNHWFNNTAYDFLIGFDGSPGQRSLYAGNLIEKVSSSYYWLGQHGDLSLLGGGETGAKNMELIGLNAFADNVYSGTPSKFGYMDRGRFSDPAQFVEFGMTNRMKLVRPGLFTTEPQLVHPEKRDFRLKKGAAAANHGAKVFVPWGLYRTVGEWSFTYHRYQPEKVTGENFYMSEEYLNRAMYYDVPRNDLAAPGATEKDYAFGDLEDWIEGAMLFDGKTRYCVLLDADLKRDYPTGMKIGEDNKVVQGPGVYPGAKRRTVDMGTNSFLVEIYFKTSAHRKAVLVSKEREAGYRLALTEQGAVGLQLRDANKELFSCFGTTTLADGRWHHVIAEINRQGKPSVSLYVDGKPEKCSFSGTWPVDGLSLSNTGDFYVGRSEAGEYFEGAMDFLRVCRGTLADAKTTIDELYAWQFDGPALRDMRGIKPKDGKRDAGAIEAD